MRGKASQMRVVMPRSELGAETCPQFQVPFEVPIARSRTSGAAPQPLPKLEGVPPLEQFACRLA